VRKPAIRIVLPVLLAAAASLVVISVASDNSDGAGQPRAARHAHLARDLVDPNAKPAKVPRRPNVIMIVMDEFPGDSLLGPDHKIDALRYPNLAALARNATWFPNASTAYDSTPKAVPLIIDGKRPFKGEAPDFSDHKHSLFDLFGRRGYGIHESEEATAICPPRWCPHGRRTRPGILGNLNRGRRERFARFVRSIKPGKKPGFWMKHVLLPHGPYMFLPSGHQTRLGARDPIPGMNSPQGFHDAFLTRHNEQRYLLQLGFADHELGLLLNRLVKEGMYDNSLVVLTADHGMDFTVGVKDRRKVNDGNVEQIGPVPFFVKAPGQRAGKVNRAYVRTIDWPATIADVLNVKLPYHSDGASGFGPGARKRRFVRLPTRDFRRIVRISARSWERKRRAVVKRRLREYGSGLTGLYSGIGPHRDLIGQAVSGLHPAGVASVRGSFVARSDYSRVRRGSLVIPAQVAGSLKGGKRGATRDLAVAVNGRIEAVGKSWYLDGDRTEHFALMVPEATLHEGDNTVELYSVSRTNALRLLART
jgi:Sulfatase